MSEQGIGSCPNKGVLSNNSVASWKQSNACGVQAPSSAKRVKMSPSSFFMRAKIRYYWLLAQALLDILPFIQGYMTIQPMVPLLGV